VSGDADRLKAIADAQPPFGQFMGMRVVEATSDRVVMEMPVGPDLANRNGLLHGGAILAMADNVAGTATFLNLAEGSSTTTIESKTNFLRAIAIGDTAKAVATPLHRGRTTMVWETKISGQDGRTAAIVIQTQLVMAKKPTASPPA
jgi:uncharacterized protein (TIGR00369 family)